MGARGKAVGGRGQAVLWQLMGAGLVTGSSSRVSVTISIATGSSTPIMIDRLRQRDDM